jgi:YVTN family beta-propeller protein
MKNRKALIAKTLSLGAAIGMLAGCRPHDFPDYPANYREFAYVANGGSNSVSIFDVVHVRLDREIQVGQNPTSITSNPERKEVYVVNSGNALGSPADGSISVIDAEKNAVVATIPVHKRPYFIDVDASGNFAYVANSGSNSVSVIDLKLRREVTVLGTGEGPGLVRISPDGHSLVVTNFQGNSVSIFSAGSSADSNRQVRKVIEGCPGATDAVILPDSSKAFVACSGGHQLMAIALATNTAAKQPSDSRPDALEAMLDVGRSPVHLALKPDGGEVFVSNFDSDSISEVITSTNDVVGAYIMGSHPVRGIVNDDNSLLYESNFRGQEISIYSIDDGKRLVLPMPLHVGDGPDALAFSSDQHLLFAVDAGSGDVAVIRTSTHSLFTLLPTGRQPNSIAIKAYKIP